MRQNARGLATIGTALLLVTLLSAGQVSGLATRLELNTTHQWVDANNEGQKRDLSVGAHVEVKGCEAGTAVGSGTVTTTLVDPTNTRVGHDSKTVDLQCGSNWVNFTLLDSLTHKGKYTLTTVATLGSISVTEVSVFDPNVEGSMGPL